MFDRLPDPPSAAEEGAQPARLLLVVVGLLIVVLTTSTAASVYVASDSARRDAARRLPMVAMSGGARGSVHDVRALLDSLAATPRSDASVEAPANDVAASVARSVAAPVAASVAASVARADSALLAGDVDRAEAEARALLGDGRALLAGARADELADGWLSVQQGARLLVRVAQQGDAPLLAGAARRLEAVGRTVFTLSTDERRALERVAETPEDGRLLQIVRDPTRALALRTDAAAGALLRGACMNPREVMFGMSDARDAVFAAIVATLDSSDSASPGAVAVRSRIRSMQDAFHAGAAEPGARPEQQEWLTLRLVPPPVRTRAQLCRTM